MFLNCCSPRSSKARSSLPAASSCTRAETQIPPGSAKPSRRAATLTPSPKISPSSTTTSPTLMPTRNSIRRSGGSGALVLAKAVCISAAQRRASTTLANSTSNPSPVVLTRRPRFLLVRAHSIASNTEPPHSPPTPIPWIRRMITKRTAPQMPMLIGRHETDGHSRKAGHQQCRNQGRLAPDPVAPMAENRRPDGPAEKSDEKDGKRLQHADQRVGLREEALAENQSGHLAVKQEIVPFDRRADRAGD